MAQHADLYAALEALNAGKAYTVARAFDVEGAIAVIRYYAGWADKIQGETLETTDASFAYTRREPYGVAGQIILWNFPCRSACPVCSYVLNMHRLTCTQ